MEAGGSLVRLGWDEGIAALLADAVAAGAVPGRVVRIERGACTVATEDGDRVAHTRTAPAVGDWVALWVEGDEVTLAAIAERRSELARRDPAGLTQVLAANVDIVFVTAPADRLSVARVERETALAWDSGARPLVLVTKFDLAPAGLLHGLRDRLTGVEVVPTSILTGEGTGEMAAALQPSRTAVLLGPSGAGKSSLVNVLLGSDVLATGEVRSGDHRGRHTTTARQLFLVPSGGVLIDTPGLRSLSLPADHGGVAAAFPDIEAAADGCRFGDCSHEHEPACAVIAAVADGTLDAARVENYRKLRSELDFEARRDDPQTAQAAKRVGRVRSKAIRQFYSER